MSTLLIVLGILLIIAVILVTVWKIYKHGQKAGPLVNEYERKRKLWDEWNAYPSHYKEELKNNPNPPEKPVIEKLSIKSLIIAPVSMLSVAIILFVLSASIFYARPGFNYYVLNPGGEEYAIMDRSGYYLINPFAKVQEWTKFYDVKVITGEESTEGVEGVIKGGIPVRFIDQVTGTLKIGVRVQLPEDEPSFIALVKEFRHPMNLVNNTLVPTVKEQAINTTYMFTGEKYVSGGATEYRQTLDEVLKGGAYMVNKIEKTDTIYEEDYTNNENVGARKRGVRDIRTTYEIEKVRDASGTPIRYEHDITKNNLIVSQVIVDQLTLEDKFKKKLEQERDISAQRRIETRKIETAEIAQKRILAEGERDKAAERVTQEKDQVKKLIALETQVKQEESKRQLAQIALETEKLTAQTRKVSADAKRYELIQADEISAEKKYILDRTTEQVKYASQAIENAKWPQYYAPGASGGNGGNAMDQMVQLMTMQMAKSMKETQSQK